MDVRSTRDYSTEGTRPLREDDHRTCSAENRPRALFPRMPFPRTVDALDNHRAERARETGRAGRMDRDTPPFHPCAATSRIRLAHPTDPTSTEPHTLDGCAALAATFLSN